MSALRCPAHDLAKKVNLVHNSNTYIGLIVNSVYFRPLRTGKFKNTTLIFFKVQGNDAREFKSNAPVVYHIYKYINRN